MEDTVKSTLKEFQSCFYDFIFQDKLNYPYNITYFSYNPLDFTSEISNPADLSLIKKKVVSKEIKDLKEKKCKKQKTKDEISIDSSQSKQDLKMGIYSIKSSKEEKGKKQKQRCNQQKIMKKGSGILENIEQHQVNQGEQFLSKGYQHQQQQNLLKETQKSLKAMTDNINLQEKQHQQKNPKSKKNKGQIIKKDKVFNNNSEIPSNSSIDHNKQVDDFIQSIKNKKESQEKNKKNETIKLNFINKYKYLFALDPSQRLKLRDLTMLSLPIDIIDSLFGLMKNDSQDYNLLHKEQIKEVVMIIDNLIEISCIIKDTQFINDLISKIISFYQITIINTQNISEVSLLFLFNTLYSFMRIKVDLNVNYCFDKEQFSQLKGKLHQISFNAINSITNKNKQLKNNEILINALFPYLLMEILFIDDTNPNEQTDPILSQLIDKVSSITIDKKNYDNFDNCKMLFGNLNLFLKLNVLFEFQKDKIFSLFMKSSKYIEGSFSAMQLKLNASNILEYSIMIQDILVCYIHNFDLFYELDYLFYDEIFNILKNYCEKYQGVINYKAIFKDFAFIDFNFETDDSLIKFILFIMRFIKLFNGLFTGEVNPSEENLELYMSFFNKILEFVLGVNQSYLRDKYTVLLHKEIETHLDTPHIVLSAFNYLKECINQMMLNQGNLNFIKSIKHVKDLTKFYKKYSSIKKHVINYLSSAESFENIEGSIYSLFFYNFLSVSNENDIIMISNQIPYESIISIDEETVSCLMNYYIEEELNNFNAIDNALYQNSKVDYTKNLSNMFAEGIKTASFNRKIFLGLQKVNKKSKEFDIEELIKNQTEQNKRIVDALVLYYINQNWKEIHWDKYYLWKGESIINEIKEVNNQTKAYQLSYLDSNQNKFNEELLPFLIQIKKLNDLLIDNPSYYQPDDILIEDASESQNIKNPKGDNSIQSSDQINPNELKPNQDKISSGIVNFNILLTSFLQIFNQAGLFNQSNIDLDALFLFSQIQQFVSNIFSNQVIFSNLKQNKELFVSFLKRYINDKDQLCKMKEELSIRLKASCSIANVKEIQNILTQISVISQCENNITELISSKCCEQVPYLYPEEEIYSLLFTKDRKFLLNITNNLNQVYKFKILNEQKIQTLLCKAQDEENDYLEDIIYEIFGKKVIQYLEYPEEIIDFLTKMNEGMKYDLTPTKTKFYEAIFPFFYIWKNIMSKIENGFRLYTTDKQHITVIENYKTLLKFIVNYLERNSKLYEMYLLIVVSLLHLIDEQQDDNIILSNPASFDTFNDQNLTNNFDNNTYQFLLVNLFKFVKIFPSLVKFYYDESKNKLKNVFKNLICNMILPKLLRDLHERIKSNVKILTDNKIILAESISSHFIQFYFNINDEIKFQIEIKVPPIFPLKKIDISIKCNASIDERKMLNISMNLNHTLNSSIDNITDNLVIWTEDVKQLIIKGHEPCPICYFYLHTTDKSLPGIYCHTCKKKFHGLCMKEWFKNLNQKGQNSSCPMCRSEWKRKL